VKGGTYGPLMGILFAGAGLVIYHVMRKSKMRREVGLNQLLPRILLRYMNTFLFSAMQGAKK
jgi:hypothetical protein